jgi:hypothetical protein
MVVKLNNCTLHFDGGIETDNAAKMLAPQIHGLRNTLYVKSCRPGVLKICALRWLVTVDMKNEYATIKSKRRVNIDWKM